MENKQMLNLDLKNSTSKEKFKNVQDVHNNIAETYKARLGQEWENKEFIDRFIAAINAKFTDKDISPKVLELGCGWGYHVNYLCQNKIDAEGIDFSENFLKIAKTEFPKVKFHQMNALEIAKHFKPNSFDGIMAIFFLHFIPHSETVNLWKNISNVLKVGGKFFAVAMVGDNEENMSFSSCLPKTTETRLFTSIYSEHDLQNILAKNNFIIDFWNGVPKVEKEIINGKGKVVFMATKIK